MTRVTRSDAEAASRDRAPIASGDREQDLPDWRHPFTEGLVEAEAESGSSGRAGGTIPKTPPPHIPARPSNKSGEKHHLFIHFPKDPNCDTCKRTKSQELHAEGILKVDKTGFRRLQSLAIQLQQITKFSMKRTNRDCIIDMR